MWSQSPYKTVGDFVASLAKPEDPWAPVVKGVLEKRTEYQNLSPTEKNAVDGFIETKFPSGANKENVYNNMKFFGNL